MTADHATLRRESLLAHARDHVAACEMQLTVLGSDPQMMQRGDPTLLAAYRQTLRAGVSFARLVIATLEGK